MGQARVDDGVDTGCLVVSICNPSCCSACVGPRQWPSTSRIGRTKACFFWFSCFRFLGFFWGSGVFTLLVMVYMYHYYVPNSGCPVCLCQGILLCWHFAGCVHVGGMMVQFSFSIGWHSTCTISVDGTTVFPMLWGNQDLFLDIFVFNGVTAQGVISKQMEGGGLPSPQAWSLIFLPQPLQSAVCSRESCQSMHWVWFHSDAACELDGYGSPCQMFFYVKDNGAVLVSPLQLFVCFIHVPQKLRLTGSSASEAMLLWAENAVLL